ncbi:MAG: DUF6159 family protein [Anaerolineae bacterium]|jgi:hypothetical protein|nr:DUF6159 family protein [Anaerolineae bacterium]
MFFDILSQSFKFFLANPSLLIYGLVAWLWSLISTAITVGISQNATDFVALLCIALPLTLISAIIGILPVVASSHVVYQRINGNQASISEGFSVAFSRFVEIIGFMIVIGGILFVVAVFYSFIQVVPALACINLVLSIGLMIFSFGLLLIIPVITVEAQSGLRAYQRSAQLVNNSRGVVVGVIILGIVVLVIFLAYLNSIGAFTRLRYGFTPSLGILGNPVFQFAYSIAASVFSSIFTTIWYQKARERVGY